MARKFLYFVAAITILFIAGAFVFRIYGDELMEFALVPDAEFEVQEVLEDNIYAETSMWLARPEYTKNNPAMWLPKGFDEPASPISKDDRAAIFFVHPTSYLKKNQWNAPIDDDESQARARIFLRGQASAFNKIGDVWAPRYRQATIGAFLTEKPEGQMALDAAYQDVLVAFDYFVSHIPADQPIVLAGHSQGSLHLTNLLKDRVAGTPLANRIVAAYVVGWPASIETDVEAMGLNVCQEPDQTNCILSWVSFAEPAEYGRIIEVYDRTIGFNGDARKGTQLICTNPINGDNGSQASAEQNLGTLVPNDELSDATLIKGAVPARCDDRGFLLIGDPPDLGPYALPGNNYHVYDYSLFWGNVRADAFTEDVGISDTLITDDRTVFKAALPERGRILGLDIGSKTVGLALCDAGWSIATAAETIIRRKFSKDLEHIKRVIAEQNVVGLVAGLPLNLDGSQSKQTQSSKAFVQNLRIIELPILLWDERWSTQAVERDLIASDVTRKKRAKVIDQMAAAYILQGAIDGLAALD